MTLVPAQIAPAGLGITLTDTGKFTFTVIVIGAELTWFTLTQDALEVIITDTISPLDKVEEE